MANPDEIISLPQGGGAIEGIGETFSPDLFTGTGNFTVPIALPPGRNGFQPELNLVYSTGNGNGVFGSGWSLSIPGVARETSRGIPQYQDASDTFVLSGAEKLVAVAGDFNEGIVRYRPRTEGLFACIEYHRDAQNSFWIVRSKDGLVSTYGTPARFGDDPAAIADPANSRNIFAWKLTETQDPFGNRIIYEYIRDPDGIGQWDQVYLKRIRYIDVDGNAPNGSGDDFLVSVNFEYEERPDPFSNYRSGFQIRTTQRCSNIDIQTHTNAAQLIRRYQFVYLDQRVVPQGSPDATTTIGDAIVETVPRSLLPLNGMSLLSQMRITGHDDTQPAPENQIQALPPLEFSYTQFDPRGRQFFPLQGRDLPVSSLANPGLELVDLFGNGLPDLIEMNGTVRYWRNLGGGRFDLPRPMNEAPAGLTFADAGVQLIDANGNGRADLLVSKPNLAGYYPMRFGGYWDHRSFQRYQVAPSFDLEGDDVALVDLNGDGVTDAIRSGNRMEYYFNDPIEGWEKTHRVERRPLPEFPDVSFSDPRVRLADMSGDGLQDIVIVYEGNIEYWPNLGHGNWGRRVHMRNSPRLPNRYDPRQVLIGDVDGDGAADVLFVDHCKITLWINQSGNGFSDPIEIDGTPGFTNQDDVRLIDLLGTGVSGILWSQRPVGGHRDRFFFHDFTGGVKPYLLNHMDNHRGATTQIYYRSSTEEYLRDQAHRETRWNTTLPFPVQVVSQVEVIDQFSRGRLITEYRYHHGYWDGGEREFRGFGHVDTQSTETFDRYYANEDPGSFDRVQSARFAPPTLTKSWFHLGPVGDAFGDWETFDQRLQNEFWFEDPPIFNQERQELQAFIAGVSGGSRERRNRRDAFRALRGTLLRSELYALDGDPQFTERPYTVTESAYGLIEKDEPTDEFDTRQRIFFPHPVAQRTTQWERGDDPLTRISYTGDYDAYGLPRRQLQIACPRGWRDVENDTVSATDYLATYAESTFAQRDDFLQPGTNSAPRYIVDRAASANSFQIFPPQDQPAPVLTVTELKDSAFDGSAPRDLIGQSFNYYDGDAFVGLPLATLGDFGALVRNETLVATETILAEAYREDDNVPPTLPPYLDPTAAINWPSEYPEPFRQQMPPLAGYRFNPGDATHSSGYFVDTARNRYDFQTPEVVDRRGLVLAMRDPLERETAIEYDAFNLLPARLTDPAGLTTEAENDYRVLQPFQVTDPNGNRTRVGFSPVGLPLWIAVMGKEDEPVGDTPDNPGTRFEYNLLAWDNSPPDERQPVFVHTIRRIHHINDTHIPAEERDETIESREYSDGFGRLLQARTQAEDELFGDRAFGNDTLPADQNDATATSLPVTGRRRDPDDPSNVVVSGWQIYDNKGQVVEQFEPFYDSGYEYLSLQEARQQRDDGIRDLFGRRIQQFYDPRGQVIRTRNPDGSEQRVIYGVPPDLDDPDSFEPTPWEAYTYDANDLAPMSEGRDDNDNPIPLTDHAPLTHHFTPANIVIDALGRTVSAVQRNRAEPAAVNTPLPPVTEIRTESRYDIRGNLLTVIDALDRSAFEYTYDLANNAVRVFSIDAGTKRTVLDALGNPVEQRDSKGALILSAFDTLNRPIDMWARDDTEKSATLRQHLVYGDHFNEGDNVNEIGVSEVVARQHNTFGRLVRHYDEGGMLRAEDYDFKGNLLEKTRQVISDQEILSVFSGAATNTVAAYQVD
ncbi:MAG: SpvB/TcaC N-terminal domain-containing protein, partial [Desulfobacterales bacterium]